MSSSRNKLTGAIIAIAFIGLTVALVVKNTSVREDLPDPPDPSTIVVPTDSDGTTSSNTALKAPPKNSSQEPRGDAVALRKAMAQNAAAKQLNDRGPSPTGPDGKALPTGIPSKLTDGNEELAQQKDQIQGAVIELQPKLKACYETTLKDFPDAAGKVVLGFEIKADADGEEGVVELSELNPEKTTLFDQKLHDCMLNTVSEIRVDPPVGGGVLRVNYPFNFSNESNEKE